MAPRPRSSVHKDKFRRRNITVRNKARELAQCGAQVYVVVLFCGQFYVYTSHTSDAWLPDRDHIVGYTLSSKHALYANLSQDQSFPVPQVSGPNELTTTLNDQTPGELNAVSMQK